MGISIASVITLSRRRGYEENDRRYLIFFIYLYDNFFYFSGFMLNFCNRYFYLILAITILCKTTMNTADAISKLTEALMINPLNHETLWLLGNCFANQALMECDLNKINRYKAKASASYQKALVVVATAFILLLSHFLKFN